MLKKEPINCGDSHSWRSRRRSFRPTEFSGAGWKRSTPPAGVAAAAESPIPDPAHAMAAATVVATTCGSGTVLKDPEEMAFSAVASCSVVLSVEGSMEPAGPVAESRPASRAIAEKATEAEAPPTGKLKPEDERDM